MAEGGSKITPCAPRAPKAPERHRPIPWQPLSRSRLPLARSLAPLPALPRRTCSRAGRDGREITAAVTFGQAFDVNSVVQSSVASVAVNIVHELTDVDGLDRSVGGFRREVQCNVCSGSPGKGQIFLPPSPPSAGFRGCEGGSGERKIEKVQSAQALHFASEFRPRRGSCRCIRSTHFARMRERQDR